MQRCNIAITGFGSIGKSVASLLWQRQAHYAKRYGADVRLTAVCASRAGLYAPDGLQGPSAPMQSEMMTGLTGTAFIERTNANVLIDAGPTDYATGGPAYAYIRSALIRGMHAIAISKGALIFDLTGLRALAAEKDVALKFSGATAAGLPTLDLLEHNLAGCRVLKIEGILTATTNYVLSQMMAGIALQEAVAEAQRLGMAEPDPRFDIDGWDTACKITLLANAAFTTEFKLNDIAREGIADISRSDVSQWLSAGVVPKLVGTIEVGETGISADVKLRTYSHDHLFAHVGARMKAIKLETDSMGHIFAICDASPLATAAAALKDLEHIFMNR